MWVPQLTKMGSPQKTSQLSRKCIHNCCETVFEGLNVIYRMRIEHHVHHHSVFIHSHYRSLHVSSIRHYDFRQESYQQHHTIL